MGNKSTEIRVKYENILSHDIEELVNMSAEYRDRCCKSRRRENNKMFCNDTQVCKQLNMPKNEDVVETAEQPRRKCNQAFCKLKENISSLRSCWNKFEKMISR
ncbi:UNVERIFIED_CONTAM: hypothetical protein H355_011640 [Colinus virginianus]|nr:hypothetical protein H355_011640 [Colinus virginianus]